MNDSQNRYIAPIIIRMANILGMYFVFVTNFSRFIFEIRRLKTNSVNPKPKQYKSILKTAYIPSLEDMRRVMREIRYAL